MKEGTFMGISQYENVNLQPNKINKMVVFKKGRVELDRIYNSGIRIETAYGSFSSVKSFKTRGYGNPILEIIYD
jgi:hypothetical protein